MLYRLIRDMHLYAGLFVSPFVVIFAISVLSLNHSWVPGGESPGTSRPARSLVITPAGNDLDLAGSIQRQLGIDGEIDFIRTNEAEGSISFPITAPGYRATIQTDLRTGATQVEEERTGIVSAMNYLHKMPGPHNVAVRGNWIGTRAWKWFADATVYLLLFLTASGIYLWAVLKRERKVGLLLMGAGAATFFALVLGIVGPR